MRPWPLLLTACLTGGMSSCSSSTEERPREVQEGSLASGVAATVGQQEVTNQQVRAVALARGVSPKEARSMLVFDALMAAGARQRGYHQRDAYIVRRRSVLARALLELLKKDAARGAITDAEVADLTERSWLDLDRPVARQVIHAVVLPEDPTNAQQAAKADEIAGRIADLVRGATDSDSFKKEAEKVDGEGMKVLVQDLAPVTEDCRVADLKNRPPPGVPPQRYDPEFVKHVFALEAVGDKTKPFRSPFGTHVAMLLRIQPERRFTLEQRRKKLAEEIRANRVRAAVDTLTEKLRQQAQPSVERNASSLMELVLEEPTARGQ